MAPSSDASAASTFGSRSVSRAAFEQVQQVAARRRVGLPRPRRDRHVETIGGRHQLRDRDCRVARDDEQRALARIGQVERGLEEPHRQRVVADGLGPQPVLRLQVEQVPRGAAEREDLRAFREDLDLARRAEHGAHVPVLQRGPRVRLIGLRARHLQRLMPARPGCPSARCR